MSDDDISLEPFFNDIVSNEDGLKKNIRVDIENDNSAVNETPITFEDASFVEGDSPVTLNFNDGLGRKATEFTVINDGAGNFTVSLSNDGSVFGNEHTMKNGEVYFLDKINVHSMRITRVADSSYRVVAI